MKELKMLFISRLMLVPFSIVGSAWDLAIGIKRLSEKIIPRGILFIILGLWLFYYGFYNAKCAIKLYEEMDK